MATITRYDVTLLDLDDIKVTPTQRTRMDALIARLNGADQYGHEGAYFGYFQVEFNEHTRDDDEAPDLRWCWCVGGTNGEGNAWESDNAEADTLDAALDAAEDWLPEG